MPNELRIGDEVPPPEPPRLLDQSEQPLQSELLSQPRRANSESGQDIKASADANCNVYPKLVPVFFQEVLLPWHTHPDHENVRSAVLDLAHALPGLLWREVAVGHAAELQARVAIDETTRGGLDYRPTGS